MLVSQTDRQKTRQTSGQPQTRTRPITIPPTYGPRFPQICKLHADPRVMSARLLRPSPGEQIGGGVDGHGHDVVGQCGEGAHRGGPPHIPQFDVALLTAGTGGGGGHGVRGRAGDDGAQKCGGRQPGGGGLAGRSQPGRRSLQRLVHSDPIQ